MPSLGWQEDGIVQYTFAPGTDPDIIEATEAAAHEWNKIPQDSGGHNVNFCQRTADSTRTDTAPTCPSPLSTDDGYTVTIQLIDPNTNAVCGDSPACVPKGDEDDPSPIDNRTMYIADPAYVPSDDPTVDAKRVIWTNNAHYHGKNERTKEGELVVNLYLPSVIMHEFGHTAGLDDLRDLPEAEYGHHIMFYSTKNYTDLFTSIPGDDALYLQQNQRRGEDD